jgi:TonB family protein
MAAKNKPYEQFGPFVLFRKLESDSLSELWRAARIDGSSPENLVALRRFTGGNREAMNAAVAASKEIVPQLNGTSFVKHQVVDSVDGVPFLAHDYAGGRSLRHIVDRARGASGISPNPIPLDQAIVVAEKVALSLATAEEMRLDGHRLTHGALLPQFVWITDDGEIRVAGHGLGSGLVASLRSAPELARYVAPEMQQSGSATKSSEVFSMGALLFLLITGAEPPDAMTTSAFAQSLRAAKTFGGHDMPADIRAILDKSLTLDPSARYASMGDMKQAISALANSGNYSATTFNLAFYVSNLLKKEFEGEALDRDRESKVNLAPYLEPAPAATAMAAAPIASGHEPTEPQPAKSRMPLAIAAGVAVVVIGGGAYYMFTTKAAQPAAKHPVASAAQLVPQKKQPISLQPLVAAAPVTTSNAAATNTSADEATRKKAFEAAVQQKLQEEVMKLQADYTKSLQKQQSKNAPVQVASAASPTGAQRGTEESAPSAAQLDQQRMSSQAQATQTAAPTVVPHPAPQQQAPALVEQQAAAAPAHTVREGDVVDVNDLDSPPHVSRFGALPYPPMALRQRAEATILATALIDENGNVEDVRILRGDKRYGFEDAAVRAVRATKFTSPVKDGKRVKSWFPVPVNFKLPS